MQCMGRFYPVERMRFKKNHVWRFKQKKKKNRDRQRFLDNNANYQGYSSSESSIELTFLCWAAILDVPPPKRACLRVSSILCLTLRVCCVLPATVEQCCIVAWGKHRMYVTLRCRALHPNLTKAAMLKLFKVTDTGNTSSQKIVLKTIYMRKWMDRSLKVHIYYLDWFK